MFYILGAKHLLTTTSSLIPHQIQHSFLVLDAIHYSERAYAQHSELWEGQGKGLEDDQVIN